jgi:hypothetical protein
LVIHYRNLEYDHYMAQEEFLIELINIFKQSY